jgi:hypothetical protein
VLDRLIEISLFVVLRTELLLLFGLGFSFELRSGFFILRLLRLWGRWLLRLFWSRCTCELM